MNVSYVSEIYPINFSTCLQYLITFPIIDINECGSNPCLNEGLCRDGDNGYQCECAVGYAGRNCERIEGKTIRKYGFKVVPMLSTLDMLKNRKDSPNMMQSH